MNEDKIIKFIDKAMTEGCKNCEIREYCISHSDDYYGCGVMYLEWLEENRK